jgi:ATP-binding cassette, subfamily B, multidrug efflux pump
MSTRLMSPQAPDVSSSSERRARNLRLYHEEQLETGFSDKGLLADVWPFLKPQKFWLSVALGAVVATAILSLIRPLIMLWAIDESIKTGDPAVMMRGGAAFAGVAILEQLIGFAQIYATQVVGVRAMADLRLHIFKFLGALPLAFFERQPVGRIVTRVTNDVDAMQELFSSGALNALGDLISLVGVVIMMVSLDFKLSLIGFLAMPPIALLVFMVRRRARDAFRSIRGETARMNANMNEQVNGVALIQAYGRQRAMLGEFDAINSSYRDANIRSVKYDAIQDAAIDALSSVSLAAIVIALGYHAASFGTVVAITSYLRQFFEPISMLAQRFTLLQAALAGAERVFGLLRVEQRDAPTQNVGNDGDPAWAMELSDVSFAYKPGTPVLHGVSLSIAVGQRVALVGPTGSGKSTITALLLRLYELSTGTVRVFGRDVSTLERDELRRKFAVVPQDVFLFPGTLAENISADEEPNLERVQRVIEQLGVADLLLNRPLGLLAEVRGGGSNFSAGERQLIAFCRALYRDAPILVLDEATASVDSQTEARLQAALNKLMEGRTSLVVAHRLSTIVNSDTIVVLQQGHVVEQGTHDTLLKQNGLYSLLYRLAFAKDQTQASAGDERS